MTGENGPTVNPDGSLTFIYKSDFDENGILYYIGTDGLTTDYTNPAEGSRVIVERSSDGAGVLGFTLSDARSRRLRRHIGL